jgi:hypothetical protein
MQSVARIVLFLLLLLTLATSTYSQTPTKQQLAEATADKIIHRFYETLDFGDVYREFYVRNANIRRSEVQFVMRNMIGQLDHMAKPERLTSRKIDDASFEHAYIAMSNFHWVSAAAFVTYKGDETKFRQERQKIWNKYMTPLSNKSSGPILTSNELDEKLTASFEAVATFMRNYVVRTAFDTPEFRRHEQAIIESRPPDNIHELKQLFAPAGMTSSDNVLIVRRGRFYLYMLEENGEFRMLSWNNRIRD